MNNVLNSKKITEMAKALFAQKRAGNRLDGWFIAKEAELELSEKYKAENEEVKKALILRDIVKTIPIMTEIIIDIIIGISGIDTSITD